MKAVKLRKTGRWMAVACAMVAASFSAGTVFASDLQNCYLSSVQVQSTTLRELFGLIGAGGILRGCPPHLTKIS